MSEHPDPSARRDDAPASAAVARAAVQHPGLELLVLHGSRARGDEREGSDWDFAYLGSSAVDHLALYSDLSKALDTDRIDLANLDRAGGLLRFRAARDGAPVYERTPRRFELFWLDAVGFWLDAEPTLDRAYGDLLDSIGR